MAKYSSAENLLPTLPCACASLRRAARAVTRLYDKELSGTGLELAQYTLMMALESAEELNQAKLAGVLLLDQTTLTRTLAGLLKKGLVEARPGEDRRERHFRLSALGRRKYKEVLPLWEKAQSRLEKTLPTRVWDQMTGLLDEVAKAAAKV